MMRTPSLFFGAVLVFSISSCGIERYIYSSAPANNPYFTKKGESKLAGYYSVENETNLTKEYHHGYDLQGAYAVGNHWALTADYFSRRERDSSADFYSHDVAVRYKRNLIGFGGGYFTPLQKNEKLWGAIFAGFATGKFSFSENNSTFHESRIGKWYIQPALNFNPKKAISFSIVPKVIFVHYGNIKTNYTQEELKYYSLDELANSTVCFFEPSLNVRFGIPNAQWVSLDLIITGTSDYKEMNTRLSVRGTNFAMGFSFDLSKAQKKSASSVSQ